MTNKKSFTFLFLSTSKKRETTAEERKKKLSKTMTDDAPTSHPLEHKWTLWFDNQKSGGAGSGKMSAAAWGQTLRSVYTFDTVEDFWRCEFFFSKSFCCAQKVVSLLLCARMRRRRSALASRTRSGLKNAGHEARGGREKESVVAEKKIGLMALLWRLTHSVPSSFSLSFFTPKNRLYNNIKPPSWLENSTDLHLFKEGIEPKVRSKGRWKALIRLFSFVAVD